MSMFCYQCQETAAGKGCSVRGVCGKEDQTARLQDLVIYVAKGLSIYALKADELGFDTKKYDFYIMESLFMTITNANFDDHVILAKIKEGLSLKEELKKELLAKDVKVDEFHDAASWYTDSEDEMKEKAQYIGILAAENEDIRSLRELLTYGIKGMAAYAKHAYVLGYKDESIFNFMKKGLKSTTEELPLDQLIALVVECGKFAVDVMALLDKANTETYGTPEITKVNIGVDTNPGILISGHDLKDLEQLLKQTKDSGVDVYTHGEMLPAHYYPEFKKYDNFKGNYGNAWWLQNKEFESFNGPILMTTNCIIPPRDSYKDRIFTTSVVGFAGVKHITGKEGEKDFSEIIELAKTCPAPTEIETGEIVGGFAHSTVLSLADKVIDAVKSGAIKKFVVMAGCDGRMKSREYYTDFAKKLPQDTVILTAGCAKYRYNKLDLGDIGGIPRVLDAGQCNDSYSLAVIALKLKEAFELEDINELPIVYNIAWYEQKAVTVLLALLYLGVKNIHLGPTLPAFLSPTVVNFLVETFNISGIDTVENDIAKLI
ncbi:hydroxylamine reductase [Desulfonispora thiosulfatigenes DSM 11270]|uniref:Hydroxylamine reductase n=1 Tax=Desulfonispora thiosulfatigenes DSM 11270 TaxID=656914 RepID=A0A1W1VDD6_DESTI|nr:hydroxylamine reductase [Desulfonispora thiosulfatigenes]SMB90964.1 hydroxylamine reductase [Desulfonispora thiosulfatigenes DSM 11270]